MRAFQDYNPIAVAVCFLAVIGVSMFSMNPILLLFSLGGALTFSLMTEEHRRVSSHLFYLVLFLLLVLINPLVSHRGETVLFVLNEKPITWEATFYGITAALMVSAVLYWFRGFSHLFTSDKLLYLFGKCSPKIALVLSMGLRYVPLMLRESKEIRRAQKAMGLYREEGPLDRAKGEARIFSTLATRSLENGIITADSMAARGYGVGKRTCFSLFSFQKADLLPLLLTGGLLALTLFPMGFHALDFSFYPRVVASPFTFPSFLGYFSFFLLSFLPAIFQGKDYFKWKYYKSKI